MRKYVKKWPACVLNFRRSFVYFLQFRRCNLQKSGQLTGMMHLFIYTALSYYLFNAKFVHKYFDVSCLVHLSFYFMSNSLLGNWLLCAVSIVVSFPCAVFCWTFHDKYLWVNFACYIFLFIDRSRDMLLQSYLSGDRWFSREMVSPCIPDASAGFP